MIDIQEHPDLFMIKSFQIAQETIIELIERNTVYQVCPIGRLTYALSACAIAIRGLRDGSKTVPESLPLYQEVGAITEECDLALLEAEREAVRDHHASEINDLLRDWYGRGWLMLVNGVLEMTSAGYGALFEREQAV